jgi:hypothetical protein
MNIKELIKSIFGSRQEKEEISKRKLLPEYEGFRELKSLSGKKEKFEDFILKPGKVGIILGARGTGKSALGMRLLENVKARTGENCYVIGFNEKKLPRWIQAISSLSEVENNSFLLADESGINFSSRESMSSANKLLSELLLISRHKNISILFITQNSANIEINTLRQADYLLLKRSSLLQRDFERKKIRDIYDSVAGDFRKFDGDKGLTYVYSDVYRGFVSNSLPNFWTDGLSRSYSAIGI